MLAFDGRVVECFGFGYTQGARVHIAQAQSVEFTDSKMVGQQVVIEGTGGSRIQAKFDLREELRPSLEAWLGAVRSAAPNLKEAV